MNFEEAYAKLEGILEKMTKNDVSLDKALAYYDEADKLLEFCSKKLDEAEKKIQMLTKTGAGALSMKDFNPTERDETLT